MWDARGHGLSDPPKPADEPDVMVDDLAGLIRELKLVKPIVMGHSMGSATAAWFGAKYPDIAHAIVLEDPGLVRRVQCRTPPLTWRSAGPAYSPVTIRATNNS